RAGGHWKPRRAGRHPNSRGQSGEPETLWIELRQYATWPKRSKVVGQHAELAETHGGQQPDRRWLHGQRQRDRGVTDGLLEKKKTDRPVAILGIDHEADQPVGRSIDTASPQLDGDRCEVP